MFIMTIANAVTAHLGLIHSAINHFISGVVSGILLIITYNKPSNDVIILSNQKLFELVDCTINAFFKFFNFFQHVLFPFL